MSNQLPSGTIKKTKTPNIQIGGFFYKAGDEGSANVISKWNSSQKSGGEKSILRDSRQKKRGQEKKEFPKIVKGAGKSARKKERQRVKPLEKHITQRRRRGPATE